MKGISISGWLEVYKREGRKGKRKKWAKSEGLLHPRFVEREAVYLMQVCERGTIWKVLKHEWVSFSLKNVK